MNAKHRIAKLRTNHKLKVFLFFLVLSALFWVFSTLSEEYNYLTKFDITYKNIPSDLMIQGTPIPAIDTQIKASGFTILIHKIRTKSIKIDVSKFTNIDKYNNYYLTNQQIPIIQQQFNDIEIIRFVKDSIYLSLGKLKQKRVPIKSALELSFKSGYKLTKDISIQPDSINISGPEIFVDSIAFISTLDASINDIEASFEKKIKLHLPKDTTEEISYDFNEVTITGDVKKFTEGQLEIPVEITDVPEGIQVEVFPKNAIIKYQVTFDNYQKVSENSFIISCTYPKETNNSEKKLSLHLVKKPDFISDYTIDPQQVTYLIKK